MGAHAFPRAALHSFNHAQGFNRYRARALAEVCCAASSGGNGRTGRRCVRRPERVDRSEVEVRSWPRCFVPISSS